MRDIGTPADADLPTARTTLRKPAMFRAE